MIDYGMLINHGILIGTVIYAAAFVLFGIFSVAQQ